MSDTGSIAGCSDTGSFITNPAFRNLGSTSSSSGLPLKKTSLCHDSIRGVFSDSELEQQPAANAGGVPCSTAGVTASHTEQSKPNVSAGSMCCCLFVVTIKSKIHAEETNVVYFCGVLDVKYGNIFFLVFTERHKF